MRNLAKPEVLKSSFFAALITALACYPRLLLWPGRPQLLGIVEAVLFLCAFVLWGFVFAWHTKPVFPAKLGHRLLVEALLSGIMAAVVLHLCFDPVLRQKMPNDYPANYR